MDHKTLVDQFRELYGSVPSLYFAPGRVNIIGEHTDYNGGLVLPTAISFGTYLAVAFNDTGKVRFITTNFPYQAEIELNDLNRKHDNQWVNYPLGVIDQFAQNHKPLTRGMDLLYSGDIPNGAGLSSSASIELVTAVALNELLNSEFSRLDLIKMSQSAENQFVGMQCGIMDQFAVGMSKANSALFLNCRTLDYDLIPLDLGSHVMVIMNTNKRRELSESKYNERVAECKQALEALRTVKPMVDLSDMSLDEFDAHGRAITDPVIYRRARHVISENHRVLAAVEALKQGDLYTLGQLMNDSHESLRHDYEVTGIELDTMVMHAQKFEGVVGARMTGAGFGGCAIAIVQSNKVKDLIENITLEYETQIQIKPEFYVALTSDGAGGVVY